ncbi:MAG: hypothetical protein GY821_07075 [Gammaproteobacteria bacterium]|nr:hypothetical protein [Gammaproteobacteria bacterium]
MAKRVKDVFALAVATARKAKRQAKRSYAYHYRWVFYVNMIFPSPSIKVFSVEKDASKWNRLKLYLFPIVEPLAPFFLFYQLIYSTASTFPVRLALFFSGLIPLLIGCLTHMTTKVIWYIICFPLSYPLELYRHSTELDGDQLLMATWVWAIGTALVVGAIFWLWPIVVGVTGVTFVAGLTLALIHGAPYLALAVKIVLDICISMPPVILISSLLISLVDTVFCVGYSNCQIDTQISRQDVAVARKEERTELSCSAETESNSKQEATLILADNEATLTSQTFAGIQRALSGTHIDIECPTHTLTKTLSTVWNQALDRNIEDNEIDNEYEISKFSKLSIN